MAGTKDHPPGTTATPVTHDTNTGDLDTVALGPDPTITVTGAAAAMPLTGVNPDHSIGLSTTISHASGAPVSTTIVVIHSTSRHISRDDSRSHHRTRRQHYKPSQGFSWKSKDRKHKQVTIDDPPSDYYSLDDSDRSLDDDLN